MTRTSTSRRVLSLLAACVAAATAHPALAGSFSVSPVRIFMEARERATGVTIINEGDTDLVMQAELFEWKQKPDGTDELLPTQDLVLAPPILKLAKGGRQTVRLANLRPPVPGEQLTYRLIVREVPEALAPKDGVKIQVALAFSLPIFITPPGAKREMACTASRASPTALRASCENHGHAYAQPASITLTTPSGNTLLTSEIRGGYILPGISRNFDLSSDGSRIPGGPLKLQVTQDDGSKQVFDVRLPE